MIWGYLIARNHHLLQGMKSFPYSYHQSILRNDDSLGQNLEMTVEPISFVAWSKQLKSCYSGTRHGHGVTLPVGLLIHNPIKVGILCTGRPVEESILGALP